MLGDKPYSFDRVFRLAVSAAAIYGLVLLADYLSDVLLPFAVAFLLAYLLNPAVTRLEKKIKSREIAVFATLAAVATTIGLVLLLVTPLITAELRHIGQLGGRLVSDADLAQRAAEKLPPDVWQTLRDYARSEQLKNLLQHRDAWSLGQAVLKKLVPGLWGIVAGTTNFLFGILGLFVIGLYLVFLLMDFKRSKNEWKSLIPPDWQKPVLELLSDFDAGMNRYFRGQAVVASTVGVLFALGFSLIGLPMGILLGLFIGLLNMVPYLQIVGLIPAGLLAVVMALDTGGSVVNAVGLVGLTFVVVQVLQDAVITPRVMGKVTGLSPAMILLSISVWGKLLGFLGLVIALPGTCLVLAYYRRLLSTRS